MRRSRLPWRFNVVSVRSLGRVLSSERAVGIHVGEADERDGDYFGPVLNRTARLMAAGHGGQVLCSAIVAELARPVVSMPVEWADLGQVRLRDLLEPLDVVQVSSADVRSEFPPLRTLGAASGQLPVQRTELLGRAGDVAAVAELVMHNRLVTLTGFGGIGKTRLALAVAAEVSDRFSLGAHFVDLAPVSDGELAGLLAVQEVGISAERLGVNGSIPERAAAALAGRDLLLVLDNCEHIVDDLVTFVDCLLDRTDRPVVLATSREALEIDGEHRYRVRPLEVADGEPSAAVELFVQRAAAVGGRVDPADQTLVSICRQLEGVPLAIELAAALTALMQPHELVLRLDHQLEVLSSRRRRGRHRSLEAVLEWSWNLLDAPVADLLLQLGVFTGGWTLEAAEAVCDEPSTVARRLDALVASSLVEVSHDARTTRYRTLEPVREFAVHRLEADPRHGRLRDRHLAWWVEHATTCPLSEQWFSGEWATELEGDFDNLRGAVARALDTDRAADAAALMASTVVFSMDGYRTAELTLLADAVMEAHPHPPARFWLASAINFIASGQHDAFAERLGKAMEQSTSEGDAATKAWAAAFLSYSTATFDPNGSTAMADVALEAARSLGDPGMLLIALGWTGGAAYLTGDTELALRRLDEAGQIPAGACTLAACHVHRTRMFVALDVPEAGDPHALLDAAIACAPPGGYHHRNLTVYRIFEHARLGNASAVTDAIDDAFNLSESTGDANDLADASVAAAEFLEAAGRPDAAATIIAALHQQPHTFPELYLRYRRARARLPASSPPDRPVSTTELHNIVHDQLLTLIG